MDMKKMGFTDKVIFILGITLAGVIAFVLVMGVIVAMFKFYMDSKMQSVHIHSAPMLDEEPEVTLNSVPIEQRLAEGDSTS